MKIEDCKEGAKVRWKFNGDTDEGVICERNGSIFIGDEWVLVNFSGEIASCRAENLTAIEEPTQDTQVTAERKYSKEEIIEYMESIGYLNVETNIQGIDDYFTSENEEEREAINLLKSKGYTVQK